MTTRNIQHMCRKSPRPEAVLCTEHTIKEEDLIDPGMGYFTESQGLSHTRGIMQLQEKAREIER